MADDEAESVNGLRRWSKNKPAKTHQRQEAHFQVSQLSRIRGGDVGADHGISVVKPRFTYRRLNVKFDLLKIDLKTAGWEW